MIKHVCDFCLEEIYYDRKQIQVDIKDPASMMLLGRAKFDICPSCIKAYMECYISLSIVITVNGCNLQADQNVDLDLTRIAVKPGVESNNDL